MAASLIYDGSTALTIVRKTEVELTEVANMGNVGDGRVVISDVDGDLELFGHKRFRVEEDDCAVETTWRGFVGARTIRRGPSEKTGPQRAIEVSLLDLNARFGFKVLRGREWRKRPKESIGERLTDLLSSGFFNVEDNGFVQYPDAELDGGDFRGQHPGDVIADMAQVAGFNFFLYYAEGPGEVSLWFQDSNTSEDWSSDLRISNVLSDIDTHTAAGFLTGTTFYPSGDTTFSRSPEQTVSGVWMPFRKGNVYRTREATEETYEPRDGTAPSSNRRRRARARNVADRFLRVHKNEEDQITTTIQVPASKVNLAKAGQRLECRFSHLATEGYGAFTWMRILERTIKPLVSEPRMYQVTMTLSPQEAGGAAAPAGPVQVTDDVEDIGMGDTHDVNFPEPITAGQLIVIYVVARDDGSTPPEAIVPGWTEIFTHYPYEGDKSPGRMFAKIADGSPGDGGSDGQVARFGPFDAVFGSTWNGIGSAEPIGTALGSPSVISGTNTLNTTIDVGDESALVMMVNHDRAFGFDQMNVAGSSTGLGGFNLDDDWPFYLCYRIATGSVINSIEDAEVDDHWNVSSAVAWR